MHVHSKIITTLHQENCYRFIIYKTIDSFLCPFQLKFLRQLRVQEREKQIVPPSCHFHGLWFDWS